MGSSLAICETENKTKTHKLQIQVSRASLIFQFLPCKSPSHRYF